MNTGLAWAMTLLATTLATGAQAATPPDVQVAARGNDQFALDLYARLSTQEGNLFFSPFSISSALAMTLAGARGQTAAQMVRTLHFEVLLPAGYTEQDAIRLHRAIAELNRQLLAAQGKPAHYELTIANALWGQKGYEFLEEFLSLTRTHYGAGLHQVDFAGDRDGACGTINAWVEEQTRGKIQNLIRPDGLSPLTRLVLTNAIYFKGKWERQFDKAATRSEPFFTFTGKVDVPMMHQTGNFGYMEEAGFQALEMPYQGRDLSMVVLLPRDASAAAFSALENSLTADNLARWFGQLRQREVIVAMPRFKMTCEFGLADTLKALGMADAFTPGAADFSGMNGQRDLFISAVLHKAFVEVNEEGTEAAAATGVVARVTTIMPRPPEVFRADHPFIFLIRDLRTGSVLFLGRLMNPR